MNPSVMRVVYPEINENYEKKKKLKGKKMKRFVESVWKKMCNCVILMTRDVRKNSGYNTVYLK